MIIKIFNIISSINIACYSFIFGKAKLCERIIITMYSLVYNIYECNTHETLSGLSS